MLKSFGAWLRKSRTDQGKSLKATALAARVAASSMCDIEKGRRRPSLMVARRIALWLDLNVNEVLARAGILTPKALAYVRRTPSVVRRLNREAHMAAVAA